jgi:tRNA threonylcarbamoyladenosine biosynthesis protein TsaE
MAADTASPDFILPHHVVLRWLPDLNATQALAEEVVTLSSSGDVITLGGDLGCGKTTFARAFIRVLAVRHGEGDRDEEVPSPTFTLVQIYERRPAPVWHFDLYRVEKPSDAYELGIEEAFENAISLIEWPKKLGRLLPAERLDLGLEFSGGIPPVGNESSGPRMATLTGYGKWATRLEGLPPP